MGILENAVPAVVICTRDRERAAAFYRDTLGLKPVSEDSLAAAFEAGGVTLRISTVADFTPHGHTMLGFRVPDVANAVRALREKGVEFLRLPNFPHDELGILNVPGTSTTQVAWMKDPDGNTLSVTNV